VRVYNNEIAKKFENIANLLAIKGADEFRIRAYRDAAITIRRQSQNMEDMIDEGKDLTQLPNIGKDLANKIKTIVKTGELPLLNKLEKQIPIKLTELLNIKGLGPERVAKMYNELNIESVEDLREAIDKGELEKLEGFGKKMVKKISRELRNYTPTKAKRVPLKEAIEIAKPFVKHIEEIRPSAERVEIAGSYRRRKATVGDLDIVAVRESKDVVFNKTLDYENIKNVMSKGETKSSVELQNGMQVDLRLFDKEEFATAMIYFTGSKAHNIELRSIAKDKGWKINEYGIFEGDKKFTTKTEADVYKKLGLEYIPPELRENRGEIKAARNGQLPKLIKLKDIKGDLQIHTKLSDGENNLEEITENCCSNGYEYLAITDHSSNIGVIRGVERGKIDEYIERIRKADQNQKNIRVLAGVEVDVLEDGRLFLQDHLLKQFDVVTFAIHSRFDMDKDKQTDRILRAMDNPYVNIFAHPTGRIINKREPYQFDFEKVMNRAKENNIIMEINAHPERLDLNDINIKAAKEIGVKFSISTDAHSIEEMNYMKYGVWQARRGWIEKGDVINTLKYEDFFKAIKR
jgi:DNA polymerase (family 10)